MFRLFGFRWSGRRVGETSFPARPVGRVPPLSDVPARIDPTKRELEDKSEIAAFLARVYRNQQC